MYFMHCSIACKNLQGSELEIVTGPKRQYYEAGVQLNKHFMSYQT